MGGKVAHKWKVQQWTVTGSIERDLAECDDLSVAFGAYDAAITKFPAHHITLRHGAMVMKENGAPPRAPLQPARI